MRPHDIRALSNEELTKALEDAHRELLNLRFRASTRQLADVSQVGKTRHNIARIKTIIRERELAGES
jgi:large subunit ribosomal protein L29